MEVHRELGPGFVEKTYGDALEIEFQNRGIIFEREKEIKIPYKGHTLKTPFYADFVCYDSTIVELKAVENVLPIHVTQLLHYLKATQYKKGLLLNFKSTSLYYKRYIL